MSDNVTMDGFAIERPVFVRLKSGPQVMTLVQAGMGEGASWDHVRKVWDQNVKRKVLKVRFSKARSDGKEAIVFRDVPLSLKALSEFCSGLFGQERFEQIKDDDEAVRREIESCIGKQFLVSHEYHVSNTGKEYNKFLGVGMLPDDLAPAAPQPKPESPEALKHTRSTAKANHTSQSGIPVNGPAPTGETFEDDDIPF